MNRYPETGSPWQVPFSRLKYFVVKTPLSKLNFCLYDNIMIQSMKLFPNPNSLKTDIMILWVEIFFYIHGY